MYVCVYVHIETHEASPVFVDFGNFAGHMCMYVCVDMYI